MSSVDRCIIERFGGASRHPGRADILAATTILYYSFRFLQQLLQCCW